MGWGSQSDWLGYDDDDDTRVSTPPVRAPRCGWQTQGAPGPEDYSGRTGDIVYTCYREEGHDGDHTGHGKALADIRSWPQGDGWAPGKAPACQATTWHRKAGAIQCTRIAGHTGAHRGVRGRNASVSWGQ